MRIEGAIHPTGKGNQFNRDTWCELLTRRAEFRAMAARSGKNPFSGDSTLFHPPTDAADVVIGDCVVGKVWWSMSDQPLVNVSVETSALALVREWATELDGEFREESLPHAPDA